MSHLNERELLEILTEQDKNVGFLWMGIHRFIRMKEFQDGRLFVRTPHNPPLCGEGLEDKLAASFDLS